MPMRIAQDVLEPMLRSRRFGLRAVLGHVQPALDEVFIGFEMELEAVRLLAVTKRLVRTRWRAREMHGPRRQIERVRVPLEDVLAAVEMPAQPIALRRDGGMQAIPADLAHGVGPHVGAERGGEQLRAETDPEDRNVELQCLRDRRDLRGQMWMAVL